MEGFEGGILCPPSRRREKNGRWLSVTERGREIGEETGGEKRRRCLIGRDCLARRVDDGGRRKFLTCPTFQLFRPVLPTRIVYAPRSTDSSLLAPFPLPSSSNFETKNEKTHRSEVRIDPDLSLSTSIISKPRIIVRSKKTEAWRLGCDPCRGRSWSSSSSYFWKSLDHRTRPSSWWGGAPDDHGPPAAPFMGAPPFVTLSNPQPRKLKEKENIYISIPPVRIAPRFRFPSIVHVDRVIRIQEQPPSPRRRGSWSLAAFYSGGHKRRGVRSVFRSPLTGLGVVTGERISLPLFSGHVKRPTFDYR